MKEQKTRKGTSTVAASAVAATKRYAKSILPRARTTTSKKTTMPILISPEELHERIARQSYELFEQRGCNHGYDQEDWLKAEKIIYAQLAQSRN